mmetsp:Transcript_14107/g.19702  ORF Transcript_14107/g.19702 Transcript_14107/m.19702 type:complete len:1489 (-) Transcript_14107:919-5385(-)
MGLVTTWLNGIGLGHAIPAFRAAGIVTPTDLAELELHMYEDLGVKSSNERKKLFYLVQRIKMAVDDSRMEEEEEESRSFLRQSSRDNRSKSSRSSRGSRRSHYDDEDTPEEQDYSEDGEEYSSGDRYERRRYASESSETSRSEKVSHASRRKYSSNFEGDSRTSRSSHSRSSSSSLAPSPPPQRELHELDEYEPSERHRRDRGRDDRETHIRSSKRSDSRQRQYKGQKTDLFEDQLRSYRNEYEGDEYPLRKKPSAGDQISPMSAGSESFGYDENVENYGRMTHARSTTKGGGKILVNPRERIDNSIAVAKKNRGATKGASGTSDPSMGVFRVTPTKASAPRDRRERSYEDEMMTPSPEPRRGLRSTKGFDRQERPNTDAIDYEDGSSRGTGRYEEEKKETTYDGRSRQSKSERNATKERTTVTRSASATLRERASRSPSARSFRENISGQSKLGHPMRQSSKSTNSEYDNDEDSVGSNYSAKSRSSRSSLLGSRRAGRKVADASSVVSAPETAARRMKIRDIEAKNEARKSVGRSSISSERSSLGSVSSLPGSSRQKGLSKLDAKISADRKSLSRSLRSTGSVGGESRGSRSNMSAKSISSAPVRCVSDSMSTPSARPRIGSSATTASRSRRLESKIQNPTRSIRTGKRLSTIPSGSVAPMSPLVSLDASQLDKSMDTRRGRLEQMAAVSRARKKESGAVTPSSSRTNADMCKSVDYLQTKRDTSEKRSRSRSRRSDSGISRVRSSSNSSQRSSSSRGSAPKREVTTAPSSGSVASSRTTQKVTRSMSSRSDKSRSPLRGRNRNFENDVGSEGLNTSTASQKPFIPAAPSSAPVFVHGLPEDNSWATQVGQLREDNDHEHQNHPDALHNSMPNEEEDEMRIRVIVRKRPMSKKEAAAAGEVDVIHPLDFKDYGKVLVYQPKTRVDLTREVETLPFAFDNVFDEKSNNVQIYERTVRHLIPGVFEGRWASVFAYGQTGSGKTFTMMGCNLTGIKAGSSAKSFENLGLYYLAAQDVFTLANEPEYSHLSVGASLFEIYGGKLFDLLNNREPVKCLENHKGKVCFPGLSEHPVSNAENLMEVIEAGAMNRSTGTTSANADSSRSHAVLQLSLRKQVGRKAHVEHGRLTFIDLAGSERGADTNKASRTTRLEGAEINTSLLALKEVIRALATGDSMKHIPFRGSKLTQVLKESFVGKNSRTVMVSCVAPNMSNCEHTLNTLRYADRVKERDSDTGKLAAAVVAGSRIQSKVSASKSKLLQRPVTAPVSSANVEKLDHRGKLSEPHKIRKDHDFGSIYDDDNDSYVHIDDESSFMQEGETIKENLMDSMVYEDEDEIEKDEWEGDKIYDNEDSIGEAEPRSHSRSLLSPPQRVKVMPKAEGRPKTAPASNKEAAMHLISTHKSVMSGMLNMVKQEMSLVNCTDADRETIDDYLVELEKVQEEKLSMISTLRQSLLDYYASRGDISAQFRQKSGETADFSEVLSDGSVEDLRD